MIISKAAKKKIPTLTTTIFVYVLLRVSILKEYQLLELEIAPNIDLF
jgi:hypothetical protein